MLVARGALRQSATADVPVAELWFWCTGSFKGNSAQRHHCCWVFMEVLRYLFSPQPLVVHHTMDDPPGAAALLFPRLPVYLLTVNSFGLYLLSDNLELNVTKSRLGYDDRNHLSPRIYLVILSRGGLVISSSPFRRVTKNLCLLDPWTCLVRTPV